MKKIIGLLFLLFTLTACGTKGIDRTDPEGSAEYIKEELSIEGSVEQVEEEYFNEILPVYNIGESTAVITDGDGNIEQINFSNANEKDVNDILTMLEFPESDSINIFFDNYNMDIAKYGSADLENEAFVIYEDVGVAISPKMPVLLDVLGDNPFMVTVVYNQDRFDEFK